jgi:3-methylcrotonyl-CoA carboxylase alpha subunit
LINLARHEYFQKGDVHTGFIVQHFDTLFPPKPVSSEILTQAAISLILNENNAALVNSLRAGNHNDVFAINSGFRVNSSEIKSLKFSCDGKEQTVQVMISQNGYKIKVNEGEWCNVFVKIVPESGRLTLKVNINGIIHNYSVVITPESVTIFNQVRIK